MKHWFVVRRFYEARFRGQIMLLLLIMVGGYYAAWSIVQFLTLDEASLRFDFVNYYGGALAAAHGTDIYAEFKRSWGTQAWVVAYIYPPLFALFLAPLTHLGLLAAARVWLLVVQAAFLLDLWLILRLHPELPPTWRRLFLVAALAFMPVYLNVKFQQVATVWLLLMAATLWAALRRRDRLGGLFLALATSLKMVPVFLIPLFARLGRWRLALWGGGLLAAITGLSLLAAPQSWQFFSVVLPRIGLGNANWDNGSIDGLVSRFVEFFPGALGSGSLLLAKLLVAAGVFAVLGVTIWQSGPVVNERWRLRLSVAALMTALLMVSSVTWQHHLVTLLLPIAVAMAWISDRRPGPRFAVWLLVGYALCWMDRRAFPLPADQAVHSAGQAILVLAGTSVKLAGLSIIWLLLLAMLRREAHTALRQPERSAASAMPPAA